MKSKEARVLIAENHKGIREFLVRFLSEKFEVVGAVSSGYELMEAAIRLQPDVVITDFSLPGITGTAAMMQLREGGFDAPFVFLSADRDLVPYVASDFGTCIYKTEVASELIPAVCLALEDKSAPHAPDCPCRHAPAL